MRFKKILSDGEFEVKKRITSASEQHDAELFSLIRLADVFEDLRGSGLSAEVVSFALKAHFDFVVCDRESRPLFVIEYDGCHHSNPEQARRDLLKDSICRHFGMPFVRIDSRHLYRWNEDVVKWLLDYWFYSEMLLEAQGRGDFPEDELADPFMIASLGDREGFFPMMLGRKCRTSMQVAHKKGIIPMPVPFEWIGESDAQDGQYSAIALLRVGEGNWVIGSTRLTAFNFGHLPSDIVSELVIMELFRMLKLHLSEPENSCVDAEIASALLEKAVSGYHMCQAGGMGGNLRGITMNQRLKDFMRFAM